MPMESETGEVFKVFGRCQMSKLYWRYVSAMGAGLSIGVVVAVLTIPVNVLPSLATGLAIGLLMAVSESTVES